MVAEPEWQRSSGPHNTYVEQRDRYATRWRWWYASISDWMIQNPGGKMQDCAAALNRSPSVISLVMNTDMFRDYHSQRMAEWRRNHDLAITSKLTAVAELGLDMTLSALEKKKDQVPLQTLVELTSSSLEKLGYGVKPATPAVQINSSGPQMVVVPVGAEALVEARNALRLAEARRASVEPVVLPLVPRADAVEGAGGASPEVGEVSSDTQTGETS